MNLITFYNFAKSVCISEGFEKEIQLVEERKFDQMDSEDFFREYVFVVCNSGMKNQVATKIFRNYFKIGIDAINHPGKKKAIKKAELEYSTWFMILKDRKTDKERLELLEKTPFIGKVTKYHLARNLGIDCAKPDRHLKRIAEHFGYTAEKILKIKDLKRRIKLDIMDGASPENALQAYSINPSDEMQFVQWMCKNISKKTGNRIGTVDVILWRFCTIMPPWEQKEGEVIGW